MIIQLKDFVPINTWIETKKHDAPLVKDKNTGKTYRKLPPVSGRLHSVFLACVTPFIHFLAAILNSGYRALKLVSFYHFWPSKRSDYAFSDNLNNAGIDAFRIVSPIITLPALEVSAIYGIIAPQDGGKLYSTLESTQYGGPILAPSLQPLKEIED